MKMGLISGSLPSRRRVSGRRPTYSGASSPQLSLARMSLRTRYCCPRSSGSTRSRMSPSRHPPTHVSGGARHGHHLCQGSRTGRASEVHHRWRTLPPGNRETLRRGPDLRNHDQEPLGVGRLPRSARCDTRGYGIDRRPLEAGLEHPGGTVHPAFSEPPSRQAGARPQIGCERRRMDRSAVAVRTPARQLRAEA